MIDLGSDFETALIALAGLNSDQIDPGSTQIDLVNPDPNGSTTVRATIVVPVDTTALKALIQQYSA